MDAEPDGWSVEAFASLLGRPTVLGLGLADRGFALISVVADEGELLRIVVHRSHRRQGLGAQLLRACHDRFTEHGIRQAFLEVRTDNHAARSLYATHGWSPVGARRGYYADGTDALVLRWSPSGPRGT
ncbi:MAG: GNAT family N-acetyltransferase [Myxococcota bacterium]